MNRRDFLGFVGAAAVSSTFLDGVWAAPRRVKARAGNADVLTHENIEQAIQKACDFLLRLQNPDGSFQSNRNNAYPFGASSLATYALLAAGRSPQGPELTKALEYLKADKGHYVGGHHTQPGVQPCHKTYSLGLRCNVWLMANRTTQDKYREELRKDAAKLYKSTKDGSYGYVSQGLGQSTGDNSNSQYGLLGVWAAALNNIEIPQAYWAKVMQHWEKCQNADGGWGYRKDGTKGTMTAAGVASLFVCYDALKAADFITCKGDTDYPPIKKGLDWLEKNYNVNDKTWGAGGYYLYGIERVGLASGYKYFGKTDWYKVGATQILRTQGGDGGWAGSLDETAFRLLFLIRGRNPVLFNKLRFDGDWNNRPRDLAGLTRWMSADLEHPLNWQIINLKAPVTEWHDAPLLYISAAKAPAFSEDDLKKLRTFVHQGGTLFSVTECNGGGFHKGIRDVYRLLFPEYELVPCPPGHPIYSAHFTLQPTRPKLYILSNGVRPLAIHTDQDLPRAWQIRATRTQRYAFEAAYNVAKYVADRMTDLRARGVSHWPEKPGIRPARTVKLARLQFAGNCNPEPLAYQRFARMMATEADVNVDVVGPVPISELAGSGATVATLSGTGKLTLNEEDQAALKSFVEGGGTLIVDAAGGNKAFADAAEALLIKMYGATGLRRLSPLARMLRLEGYQIKRVQYRPNTYKRVRTRDPRLRIVLLKERPAVFYSAEDLTAGLAGCTAECIDGYSPQSAFELMRNIVLATLPEKNKT